MFSLFKNNDSLVKEIHNEFDTAQDRLLEEAHKIINENENLDFSKGEQLVRLGFTKSQEALELRKKANHLQESGKQAELVLHYKRAYPFLKFLTKDELERICTKYNLIFAPVNAYTKEVPKKNLDEIENAKPLAKDDMSMPGITVKVWKKNIRVSDPSIAHDLEHGKNIAFKPRGNNGLISQIRSNQFAGTYSGMWNMGIDPGGFLQGLSSSSDNRTIPSPTPKNNDLRDFIYKPTGKTVSDYARYAAMDYQVETMDQQGLFIAAPENHFDLEGLQKKGKKGYMQLLQRKVDDPIVFRWVKGGIQVLTKWGLEADDPTLQNELLN